MWAHSEDWSQNNEVMIMNDLKSHRTIYLETSSPSNSDKMLSNSPSTSSSSTWMKKCAFFCVSNTTLASCHQARGGIGQKVLFHITAAVCCESCTAVWGEDAMTYTLSLIQLVSCHICLELIKNAIHHWANRPMIVQNNLEWTFSQVLRND